MNRISAFLVVFAILFVPALAQAATITFDSFARGEVIDQVVDGDLTVTFSADNNNGPDVLVAFDPLNPGSDSDLAQPYTGGGNAQDQTFGKLAIIQENNNVNSEGIYTNPDDDLDGGFVTALFSRDIIEFNFVHVDLDNNEDASNYFIAFFNDDDLIKTIEFTDFIGANDVQFGDDTANFLPGKDVFITQADLNFETVNKVVWEHGGSAAIGPICVTLAPETGGNVPVPAPVVLLMTGLLGLVGMRSRR